MRERDAMTLTKVFEPGLIGGLEVPNRIVRTAHGTSLGPPPGGLRGEDFVAFHEARARGGVGLSILEGTSVHPHSALQDGLVEGYQELMAAVRPVGMRVFQQVSHHGHLAFSVNAGIPWGVSTIAGTLYGAVPEPIRLPQIEELIVAFGTAALRCREGGLDGVELHAGHGELVHQFLSPLYNTRTDEYGGVLENRMRFAKEVLRSMRAATGHDFVVGIRLSASEMPGSIGEDELRTVIVELEREGLVDFVDTSLGDYYRSSSIAAGPESSTGYELESTGQLTSAATVPTIVSGLFRTLEDAERVLVDGVADMVSMVRAHIADPDIIRKTREGRAHEVRPCIACNQGCVGGQFRAPPRIGCAVNPSAGFEAVLDEELIAKVANPRRVLVVGGGPAGLEAARVAALYGHEVTLAEESSTLGGAIRAARRGPRSARIGEIIDWLEGAVDRAGVNVELETSVSADSAGADAADVVIVATGSRPRLDGFQPAHPFAPAVGTELPHVISSVRLLIEGLPTGTQRALVLDTADNFEAIVVAEYLVHEGVAVTYVTTHPGFGGPYVRSSCREVPALEFLYSDDFTVLAGSRLVEITKSHCLVQPLQGRHASRHAADLVVLVTPNEPQRRLYDELVDGGERHVIVVGDAASPRNLQAAMADGHGAARRISAG